jgi:Domain of unknown function (DUF4062)
MNPPIFVSATSGDLGTARDLVVSVLIGMGYHTRVQPTFPFVGGDLRAELRRLIDECGMVIQLVGFRCGQIPASDDPVFGRVSHTQYEAAYAEQQGKRVLYITLPKDFPFTACDPEPAEMTEIQRRYRESLRSRGDQRGTPANNDALRALILQMRDDLAELLKLAAERHAELRRDMREGFEAVIAAFKSELAASGKKPSDLSQEELERELAGRVPNLSAEDLHRLIGYALFKGDISRIIKYAPAELIGREAETALLNDSWAKVQAHDPKRPHLLTFVALCGEGKTSLVAKWAADLAHQDWPGCDAVFAWSFYSQGTREQTAVSSDLFLAEALAFFGDAAMAGSAQGAFEKGRRLAQIVGERRALLILDGLEPLQYAPTSPTPGELKDQGLSALLKGLAATSHGLCVVTTRYALPDLRAFHGRTVREEKLARLARAAGVQLLKAHGVTGSDRRNLPLHDGDAKSEPVSEFEKLVEDVDGHALTLHIMGSFLKKAFGGDIRKRDRVTFAKASQKTDNGHAFRAMAAYARWMEDGSDEARRELAILRLMGLFDRPATADCLAALLAAPAIPGLTEPLVGLAEEDWNCSLDSLESAKLLTVNRDASDIRHSTFGIRHSLDAHPLIREYFAERLKEEDKKMKAEAPPPSSFILPTSSFCLAHRRLYEHLCASTQEGDQPTLEALQPLYQAVAHGCQAGLQQEAWDKIYFKRIIQYPEFYSTKKLGAFGTDLGALACFFDKPWNALSPLLDKTAQGSILGLTPFRLRALGRLNESLEPMRAGLDFVVQLSDWKNAAIRASNLSELELTLGEVAGAVGDAEQSVTYADRSGDAFQREVNRTTHVDALHQAGRRAEAEARFREAEQMQAESQPAYPLLYSVPGFQYCDLLLAEAERASWGKDEGGRMKDELIAACRAVSQRAAQTLKWAEAARMDILSIALDHLTLGRAALYEGILKGRDALLRVRDSLSDDDGAEGVVSPAGTSSSSDATQRVPTDLFETARLELDAAVSGLRRAGEIEFVARALLTRAWLRMQVGSAGSTSSPQASSGQVHGSAQEDLDEAWEIAERGPMKLFMADILLYRARLFFQEASYPWKVAKNWRGELVTNRTALDDLNDAEHWITTCGYHRRDAELADARAALLG